MDPILQIDALYPYYKPEDKKIQILHTAAPFRLECGSTLNCKSILVFSVPCIICYVKLNICICLFSSRLVPGKFSV
jgi:hypothetical protein